MLKIGDLIARVEAPTMLYRVTSKVSASGIWRVLPYRRSGKDLLVTQLRGAIVGDGSAWRLHEGG